MLIHMGWGTSSAWCNLPPTTLTHLTVWLSEEGPQERGSPWLGVSEPGLAYSMPQFPPLMKQEA